MYSTDEPELTVNPTECPRKDTVAALWERIQQVGVVHIRGTPASGKTILSLLLREYVEKEVSNLPVLLTSWNRVAHLPTNTAYDELLSEAFKIYQKKDWRSLRALIIIDEAQMTYAYGSLWADLIKNITPTSGLKIALFASYGSPRNSPLITFNTATTIITPMILNTDQRISIRRSSRNPNLGLFFSYTEFKDVVARVCEYCVRAGAFLLSTETVEYIWEITNGHPAGVRVMLDVLAISEIVRPFRRDSIEIPTNILLNYLQSNDFLRTMIRDSVFSRGLPPKDYLRNNPDIAKFFREVLASGRSEHDPETHSSLAICYKQGWLQAELATDESENLVDPDPKPVYIFSSGLHRRCVEHILSIQAPPFPLDKFTSVRELCFAAIRQFKPTALRSVQRGLGTGAVLQPIEGRYQDELYRACSALLGEVYIFSEWSGTGSRGRVDFLVQSQRWAIECVRDGDRLNEHISRFQQGGQYYDWIQNGDIGQYIVLDFRTSKPKKIRDIPWLYFVVFSADYITCIVYNAQVELVAGPFDLGVMD
ncbi:hypothetical protein GP486_004759 [Trichoglossum hirsutum]|uniref:Uncharacterized protein n=1 Tax=Trichoglossum hirsutum TaxID=265104 RepID=A0A9P8LAP1_9PEZI|nr:hypothetical protein GP486_004759 [Trichoglossum hirsutum]